VTRRLTAIAFGAATLGGCGTFLGSIPFSSDGQAETVVQLAPGDVVFWTQLDATFPGDMSAL
jgi:hypothetical protein